MSVKVNTNYQGQTYISTFKFKKDQPVAIKHISQNDSKKNLEKEIAAIAAIHHHRFCPIEQNQILAPQSRKKTLANYIVAIRNPTIQPTSQVNSSKKNLGFLSNDERENMIRTIAESKENNFTRSISIKITVLDTIFSCFFKLTQDKRYHGLCNNFIDALAKSNKDKNLSSLAKFLIDFMIPNIDPKIDQRNYLLMNGMVEALSVNRQDLLFNTPEALLNKHLSNEVDLARAAVFNFTILSRIILVFLHYNFETIKIKEFESANEESLKVLSHINLIPQLKNDLFFLFKHMVSEVNIDQLEFAYFSKHILKSKLYQHDIIQIEDLQVCNYLQSTCDFSKVMKNRHLYDAVITQFEEHCNWLWDKSKKIQETLSLLKDFFLYLKLGNLEDLINLSREIQSQSQFASLVFTEIKKYQNGLRDLHKEKGVLQECSWMSQLHSNITAHEQFYSNISFVTEYSFLDVIEICRQCSVHLPSSITEAAIDLSSETKSTESSASSTESGSGTKSTQKTKSSNRSQKKKNKKAKVKQKNSTKGRIKTTPDESISDKKTKKAESSGASESVQTPTKSDIEKINSTPTLIEAISFLEDNFAILMPTLLNASNSLGFQDAIRNSFDHLHDLLTVVRRFERIVTGPIGKDDLLSTIVNFVNHGALLTEQLLTALLCKAQSYEREEDFQAALTHQLPLLLAGCQNGRFFISENTWSTILYTNAGEILSRELVSLIDSGRLNENSSVEGLLSAAYAWVVSEDISIPQHLLNASFNYVANILMACNELHTQIKANNQEQSRALIAQQQKIQQMISLLRQNLLKTMDHMQIHPQNAIAQTATDPLNVINQKISAILNEGNLPIMIRKGFENLQNNLLCRLKTELRYQATLPNKELRLHYCHILLLNQYIAEQFCILLINHQKLDVDIKELDHNLAKAVVYLGFNHNNMASDIKQFLTSGKDVRALTRYRFSFSKNNYVKEKLNYVSQISQDRQLVDSGQDGFQLVESKKGGIKSMLENAKSNVATLCNLILNMIPLMKKDAN